MIGKHFSRPGPRVMIALIAIVLLIAVFFAVRAPAIDVDTAEAVRAPLLVTVDDEGETRVRDMYVVAAPISGELQRVRLEAGDPVIAGQTIVARIKPARPDFLDPRSESEVRAQIGAAQGGIRSASARISQARADRKLAAADFERIDALYERGFATRTAHDAARAARDNSIARQAEANAALATAQSELAAARARLITPSGSNTGGGALDVRSPENGAVLRVVQESEATITVGTPIIELGNPADIEIVTDLLSSDAVRVRSGSEVLIDNWGGDKPLKGKVRLVEPFGFTKISALGVEEQRVNVIIDFVDPQKARQRLGHGYRVIVQIVDWSGDDVLQVPISALFRDKGQWSVFANRNGKAQLLAVKVGRMNNEHAQILDGLDAGTDVILHPSEKIDDGRSVRLRD
ncbi:HlyD family secretion protein [Parasphingorhabdus marina DSM 22363]|uniref:HlyD family secretion protein n=1 Tax=Parasphingorhabdus marina DSM 22363 TaxID=1123272 RepID=A0A1N6CQ63_9SPHN|nr:HlyD family efflux transporter periplasmic adaptor subunit [Parasphingorhabdus marina]SIN60710.1 HlyD family secretion protein [Parasphingorhabdus marina DSM 22363]